LHTNRLFVYGTLQEAVDTELSQYLSAHSKCLGKGYITAKLYKVSWFPGVTLSTSHLDKVYGTLYEILADDVDTVFSTLDEYEGVDAASITNSLFTRALVDVHLEEAKTYKAWVYVYNKSVVGLEQISSGNFLEYVSKKK
jgi:gamma-glutamylcyclotransferase (GGCT)/AIG2-like uncharacterized protein YtfP